jgi:hypothetical protein
MKKIFFNYLDFVFDGAEINKSKFLVYAKKNKVIFKYYALSHELVIDRPLFLNMKNMFGLDDNDMIEYFEDYLADVIGIDAIKDNEVKWFFANFE